MPCEYADVYKAWSREVGKYRWVGNRADEDDEYPHDEYDAVVCLAEPENFEATVVPIADPCKPRNFMTKCRHGLAFMYYMRNCCHDMFTEDVVDAVCETDRRYMRAIMRVLRDKFFVLREALRDIVYYFSDSDEMIHKFWMYYKSRGYESKKFAQPPHCLFSGLYKMYSFATKYGRRHLLRVLARGVESIFERQYEHQMEIYYCAVCGSRRVVCTHCPNRLGNEHRCKSGRRSDLGFIGESRQWIWYANARDVLRRVGHHLDSALGLIWSAYGSRWYDFQLALMTLENMVGFYAKKYVIAMTLGPTRIAYVHH